MDYEEKYKKSLDRARGLLEGMDEGDYFASNEDIEDIFPELKESEDERIRKAIIAYISHAQHCGVSNADMIAWLEKQGEKKPADKVEPKFKVGDWITNGNDTWKIVGVKPLDYILQSQDGNRVDDTISYVDKQFHSFTIEDAKEKVLATYQPKLFV